MSQFHPAASVGLMRPVNLETLLWIILPSSVAFSNGRKLIESYD